MGGRAMASPREAFYITSQGMPKANQLLMYNHASQSFLAFGTEVTDKPLPLHSKSNMKRNASIYFNFM
jgi:hypothetical protein